MSEIAIYRQLTASFRFAEKFANRAIFGWQSQEARFLWKIAWRPLSDS
jgi:hypothetical protein